MYCIVFIYVEVHLPPFYELLLALLASICHVSTWRNLVLLSLCGCSFLQIIDEDIE